MYKLAAVTAIAAAGSIDHIRETAEMFKITLKQEEIKSLDERAQAIRKETHTYESRSRHYLEQFSREAQALVHTKEFVDLAKFVEAVKHNGPSREFIKFSEMYKAEFRKLEQLHNKLDNSTHKKMQLIGQEPHQRAIIDIDNEEWDDFNMQYNIIQSMNYNARFKIQEIKTLRAKVTAVRHTNEMQTIQSHWAEVTKQSEHQAVMKHEGEFVLAVVKALHINPDEKKWMDPIHSPVMYDVWHSIFVYFYAVRDGDMNPMLDWMIDGKYIEEFTTKINPQFLRPENYPDDLYLF